MEEQSDIQFELWLEVGGLIPTKVMTLNTSTASIAKQSAADAQANHDKYARAEAAKYRYFVVMVTTTRKELS